MSEELYVHLAIPVAVDSLFTYLVPPPLHQSIVPGIRVIAPLGRRTVTGFVVGTTRDRPSLQTIKPIIDIIDETPVVADDLLNLTRWMSEYYMTPWGEVMKAILVQGAARTGKRTVRLAGSEEESTAILGSLNGRQHEIVAALLKRGSLTVSQLERKLQVRSLYGPLRELTKAGTVVVEDSMPRPLPKPRIERRVVVTESLRQQWKTWIGNNVTPFASSRVKRQAAILEHLSTAEGSSFAVAQLLKATGGSLSTLRTLEQQHLITTITQEVIRRSDVEADPTSRGLAAIVPNRYQQEAVSHIRQSVRGGAFQAYLLHGITGSGKTQVYIESIREVLALGKTAIVLVPEIALTPQIVRRFTNHFGEHVVMLHSRMSVGERYDAWRLTREGKYSIVIGPRSAIFAPLQNIGLIVVDEEQEGSYKQFDQTPRYHARDVAVKRAHDAGAVVVLGSATPSFESYANALGGKYTLLEMPERVDAARLPVIEIVDMTEERRKKLMAFREERRAEFAADAQKARADKRRLEIGSLSDLLKDKIEDRLRKKEGIILLQNRRGFSTFIECPDCGTVEMCPNCNISLTYHQTRRHLRCHYCGHVKPPPERCPKCQSTDVRYRGFGTQRIEEELQQQFPAARILRMDLDTTNQRGSHESILRKFGEGGADILLGTQMVAKGLDFSRVTLVGVISADTQMLLPDFRSAERTFQLLTQVAGRAGRSTLPGEVVIQTLQPGHYALRHVLKHDFKGFYEEELKYRKELDYPPFSRLVLIEFRGKVEQEVMRQASRLADMCRPHKNHFLTLGPAAAAITRLKGYYRWHIVLKGLKMTDPSGQHLHTTLRTILKTFSSTLVTRRGTLMMTVDIDPHGMM